jgi:hypothetical protein
VNRRYAWDDLEQQYVSAANDVRSGSQSGDWVLMENATAEEVLMAVFLCLGVAGGAAYGWLAVGTVWATVGGALLIGVFTLLLVSLIALAAGGVAQLLKRNGR